MFAVCVEASHARGMGHFFRALNLVEALREMGSHCVLLFNEDPASERIARERSIPYEVVPLSGVDRSWEAEVVRRRGITLWLNDRLDTDTAHAERIKALDLPLVTFDDRGPGAVRADLHVAALSFDPQENLGGKKVLRGESYLILNPAIGLHRRLRSEIDRVLVTLGGSDTYGVTAKILPLVSALGRPVTVVLGPAYRHFAELDAVLTPAVTVKRDLPSMIEEFARHDLAVTGGGITPFEANASGLPCIVVANENFEIPVGQHLQRLGGSVFAGHHTAIDASVFSRKPPLATMSQAGLDHIPPDGVRRVAEAIRALC